MKKETKIENLTDVLKKATEKSKEELIKEHPEEVRKMALKVLAAKGSDGMPAARTPDIQLNGKAVSFGLEDADQKTKPEDVLKIPGIEEAQELVLYVDGERYRGDSMREKINRLDGIVKTSEEEKAEKKKERKDEIAAKWRKDAPVLRRSAMIGAVRSAEATVRQAERNGENILNMLARFLGRAITQNR